MRYTTVLTKPGILSWSCCAMSSLSFASIPGFSRIRATVPYIQGPSPRFARILGLSCDLKEDADHAPGRSSRLVREREREREIWSRVGPGRDVRSRNKKLSARDPCPADPCLQATDPC